MWARSGATLSIKLSSAKLYVALGDNDEPQNRFKQQIVNEKSVSQIVYT